MRNFKSVRFAWSKEILNGVVMYRIYGVGQGQAPQQHFRQKCRKHRSGDVKILLSVEHGLTRRRDVNDAIRIAVENDIDADMLGRN